MVCLPCLTVCVCACSQQQKCWEMSTDKALLMFVSFGSRWMSFACVFVFVWLEGRSNFCGFDVFNLVSPENIPHLCSFLCLCGCVYVTSSPWGNALEWGRQIEIIILYLIQPPLANGLRMCAPPHRYICVRQNLLMLWDSLWRSLPAPKSTNGDHFLSSRTN